MKDSLIKALADDYSRKILLRTLDQAQSVDELSKAEGIPISTSYRRVNELREEGLLTVERTVLTEDGRKYELYRSAFRSIHMDLVQSDIVIDADFNEDISAKLSRLWAAMRE